MASRVLFTLRPKDDPTFLGFVVVSSHPVSRGVLCLTAREAVEFTKRVEPFQNMEFMGGTRWRGIENGLTQFPAMDPYTGQWLVQSAGLYVVGRLFVNGDSSLRGFCVMNLTGRTFNFRTADAVALGKKFGFVNAKLVDRGNGAFISAVRGDGFPSFKYADEWHIPFMDPCTLPDVLATPGGLMQVIQSKFPRPPVCPVVQPVESLDGQLSLSLDPDPNAPLDGQVSLDMGQTGDADAVPAAFAEPVEPAKSKPTVLPTGCDRMIALVNELNEASKAYYMGPAPIMSDHEYDAKYDELLELEKSMRLVLPNSPTQSVGFDVVSKLEKVKHEYPMLSLDKTKDRETLHHTLGGQVGFLSWKLDGLSISLVYEGGKLTRAVTRGNGSVGEDVTHNARHFKGVPLTIPYTDKLVVRGEALISRETFDRINAGLAPDDQYKNARNLAAGSVRQLDSKEAASRGVHVTLFDIGYGFPECTTFTEKLEKLKGLGFDVVEYVVVRPDEVKAIVDAWEDRVQGLPDPTDGLVLKIDNIAYGEALGMTSKFPRNAIAFKWKDDEYDTQVTFVEWSVGRTGAVTPVVNFKSVDIDGTTVTRASAHNLSIFQSLKLGVGDTVAVYKANMIIPQISKNKTQSGTCVVPSVCPICGEPLLWQKSMNATILVCPNDDCPARKVAAFAHFVSRDAMNIVGLSDATLEVFLNRGFIREFRDLYLLDRYAADIIALDGFGKGSYNKLWKAIEASRDCELSAFLSSLGVKHLGRSVSRDIAQVAGTLDKVLQMTMDDFSAIPGVGSEMAPVFAQYFRDNADWIRGLASELRFKQAPVINTSSPIAGKTFCVTGAVYQFKNRQELQNVITQNGGRNSSSVSAKTDYLINNDVTSDSTKNQNAKKFGIPIISEQAFLDWLNNGVAPV